MVAEHIYHSTGGQVYYYRVPLFAKHINYKNQVRKSTKWCFFQPLLCVSWRSYSYFDMTTFLYINDKGIRPLHRIVTYLPANGEHCCLVRNAVNSFTRKKKKKNPIEPTAAGTHTNTLKREREEDMSYESGFINPCHLSLPPGRPTL